MSKAALLTRSKNYIVVKCLSCTNCFFCYIAVQQLQHLKGMQNELLSEVERLLQENEALKK
jgi:hypothetical protein